jgi:hypothetical protein
MTIIRDKHGSTIRTSRNLRGLLRHNTAMLSSPIKLVTIDPINPANPADSSNYSSEGKLCVLWENGDSCETNFASFTVLKQWLRNRRNWYGAPLRVSGQPADVISYHNPALTS